MRDFKLLTFFVTAFLSVSSAKVSLELPARVIAIGDIHGDFNAFVSILLTSKLIEKINSPPDLSEQPNAEPIPESLPSVPIPAQDIQAEQTEAEPIVKKLQSNHFTKHPRLTRPKSDDDRELYEQSDEERRIAADPNDKNGRSLFSRLFQKVFGRASPTLPESKPKDVEMKEFIREEDGVMPDWRLLQETRAEQYRWIGGETVLVQTGDMVDRGADTIAVYALLKRLQEQAREAGGDVVPLLGNHEVMNICGDWRYVSGDDYASFGPSLSIEQQYRNRKKAFAEEGFLGKWIRERDSVARVGRTIYSHAGVLPSWATISISEMNEFVRISIKDKCVPNVTEDPEGPHWNRIYAMLKEENPVVCKIVATVLRILNADRMVIGHNPIPEGEILERCQGTLFLIDVGMSSGMYGNGAVALETVYKYEKEGDGGVQTYSKETALRSTTTTTTTTTTTRIIINSQT